ncbi:MAG: NAD(+)/NADH kinase [Candidatus Gracilibacteria bacterium]|jgi:NAD+ kinase
MPKSKFKKIGLITKRNIVEHKALLDKLVKYLKSKKVEIVFDENSARIYKKEGLNKTKLLKKTDLNIVLGGDGTLLKTARRLARGKTFVLSVNLGTVGFLTECNAHNLFETLDLVFKGKYELDARSVLRVTVYSDGKKRETFLALNDAVINQGAFARLIKMDLKIGDKEVVTFKADGMIVATPTGSTAHSLSAGGPIIHPKIQGLVITPVCPNSLTMRPIIIPDTRELTVTIDTERREETAIIGLTLDGQDMSILRYGDQIKFRRSKRNLYLLRTGNRYYQMLQTKLKWGG